MERTKASRAVLVGLVTSLALMVSIPAWAEATRTEYNYAYTEIFGHLPNGNDICGFVHGYVYVYERLTTKGDTAPVPYQWVYVVLLADYCDKPVVTYNGSALLSASDHLVDVPKQGNPNAPLWSAWLKKELKLWNKAQPSDTVTVNIDLQWSGQDFFYYAASHIKVGGALTTNAQTDYCTAVLTGAMSASGNAIGIVSFDPLTQKYTRIVDTESTVHN